MDKGAFKGLGNCFLLLLVFILMMMTMEVMGMMTTSIHGFKHFPGIVLILSQPNFKKSSQ